MVRALRFLTIIGLFWSCCSGTIWADDEADLLRKFQSQKQTAADKLRTEVSRALSQGNVECLRNLLVRLESAGSLPNVERTLLIRAVQDRLATQIQSQALTTGSQKPAGSASAPVVAPAAVTAVSSGPWVRVTNSAGTVIVPDGGVAVQGSFSSIPEGRNEGGVPILGKVPYLGRGFRNVGAGSSVSTFQRSVSVRIFSLMEEDAKLLGK